MSRARLRPQKRQAIVLLIAYISFVRSSGRGDTKRKDRHGDSRRLIRKATQLRGLVGTPATSQIQNFYLIFNRLAFHDCVRRIEEYRQKREWRFHLNRLSTSIAVRLLLQYDTTSTLTPRIVE
jgi:hypothetical protein